MTESKEVSWRNITTAAIVSEGPCELIYAHLAVGSSNNYVILYHGLDTTGEPIVKLESAVRTGRQFAPKVPVYCPKGLYAYFSSNIDACFIQWRELGTK